MSEESTGEMRRENLARFYKIMDALEERAGGKRTLVECAGGMGWPARGVYFFYEAGEVRSDSGGAPRIVRVGTHAVSAGSKSTLWRRLSNHKGTRAGGGNHRGSIFRLLVGRALMKRDGVRCASWESKTEKDKASESRVEKRVSEVIGRMPFLWLRVEDEPGKHSLRAYVERNAIALLSNLDKPALDAPSPGWLGRCCPRARVRRSGLWNQNETDKEYEPDFFGILEKLVNETGGVA